MFVGELVLLGLADQVINGSLDFAIRQVGCAALRWHGAFAGDSYKHALAMLGMAAVGQEIPATAIDWLESNQSAGGSWDDGFGTLDNADATGMAIMALLAAGRSPDDAAVAAAVDFLTTSQAAEGGWSYGAGLPVSANSTAVVVQALIALGIDPTATDGSWAKTGRSPLDALLAWQGESGAFQADFGDGPFDDFYSTVQAIPAAAGPAPTASATASPTPHHQRPCLITGETMPRARSERAACGDRRRCCRRPPLIHPPHARPSLRRSRAVDRALAVVPRPGVAGRLAGAAGVVPGPGRAPGS